MQIRKALQLGVLLVVLVLIIPATDNLVGRNQQDNSGLNASAKLESIQNGEITITSNSEFTGAGFSAGDGSVGNPYVLKDISIYSSGATGISILNTDAYFRVENVLINGSTDPGAAGVKFSNVSNGYLINVTVTNSSNGFSLYSSSNNIFTGNIVTGSSDAGISLSSSSNNIFTGNYASGSVWTGISLSSSSNNIFTGNNASGNDYTGISLSSSSNNIFTGNNASGNSWTGLLLTSSSNNNTLRSNSASENDYGIYLSTSSSNNTLTGNNASGNNNHGFMVRYSSNNNTLTGNSAKGNGKSGFYVRDSSANNIITGNNASGNTQEGFWLASSSNTLIGNTAKGNTHGFYLVDFGNNTLTGNSAKENGNHGFTLYNSDNNTLTGNNASGNSWSGFELAGSNNNSLTENTAKGNSNNGFYVRDSSNNNTLTGNTASGNNIGFFLSSSSNDTLTWNCIHGNTGYGIYLQSASDNLVYLNFLIDNNQGGTSQALDDSLANSWINGTHGNYWSDYTGIDAGNDGIGDSSYTLDGTSPPANDTKPLVFALLVNLSTLQLTGPDDQVLEAGSTGTCTITWLPVTNIQVNTTYRLYLDDNLEDSGNWTSGTVIQVDVDLSTLDLDTEYNYTLVVTDYSNKTVVNTAWMTVKDRTDPEIKAPEDFTIEAGDIKTLSFNATDLFPANYTLYLDGSIHGSGNWTSGTPVTVALDSLSPDHYNFTLAVQDTSGNGATRTVLVTVEDTAVPVITYTGPDEISFEEGSTGNNLTASATDLYPGTYTVYQNETAVDSGDWTPGTAIVISLDALDAGVYNFTLVVEDTSGNGASLTVTVTVTKPAAAAPDLLVLLVLLSLIGAAGAAAFLFWRRRRG